MSLWLARERLGSVKRSSRWSGDDEGDFDQCFGALALLVSAGIATAGAVAKGDFQTCGKRAVADVPGPGSYKLILKVKRASCDAGQKVARKYFKKAGSIVPNVGNVEFVQHYRCVQKNYYSPFNPRSNAGTRRAAAWSRACFRPRIARRRRGRATLDSARRQTDSCVRRQRRGSLQGCAEEVPHAHP